MFNAHYTNDYYILIETKNELLVTLRVEASPNSNAIANENKGEKQPQDEMMPFILS